MIPVCYCGNRGVFNGILLSVLSMLNRTKEQVEVYLFSMDLSDKNKNFLPFSREQIDTLSTVVERGGGRIKYVDLTELYKEHFSGTINENTGYTPYSMLRLLFDLVPVPDKVIYLDADVMFTGDIASLYEQDIDGFEYGAVRDFLGKFWINKNYCNSGVMILNMPEIKSNKLFEKCRKMVVKKRMIMPDQTALNRLVKNKKYLPNRFNEQREIKDDTVIKHFCKGIKWFPFFHIYNVKQWDKEGVKNTLKITCFDREYEQFDQIFNGLKG